MTSIQATNKEISTPRTGLKTGDFVTRDGTDVHYVYDHNGCEKYDPDLVYLICIIEPVQKWTKFGEVEFNLPRRYTRIGSEHYSEFRKILATIDIEAAHAEAHG